MEKTYTCTNCGESKPKDEMESYSLTDSSEYLCISCGNELAGAGWDAVDPDHNFDSFSDWDERGH